MAQIPETRIIPERKSSFLSLLMFSSISRLQFPYFSTISPIGVKNKSRAAFLVGFRHTICGNCLSGSRASHMASRVCYESRHSGRPSAGTHRGCRRILKWKWSPFLCRHRPSLIFPECVARSIRTKRPCPALPTQPAQSPHKIIFIKDQMTFSGFPAGSHMIRKHISVSQAECSDRFNQLLHNQIPPFHEMLCQTKSGEASACSFLSLSVSYHVHL